MQVQVFGSIRLFQVNCTHRWLRSDSPSSAQVVMWMLFLLKGLNAFLWDLWETVAIRRVQRYFWQAMMHDSSRELKSLWMAA